MNNNLGLYYNKDNQMYYLVLDIKSILNVNMDKLRIERSIFYYNDFGRSPNMFKRVTCGE